MQALLDPPNDVPPLWGDIVSGARFWMKNGPRFGSALLESPEGGPGGGWGGFTVDMSIVSSTDNVIPGH